MQRLIEHGGIYLDADVLVHRDFDDLLGESVVLGREGDVGIGMVLSPRTWLPDKAGRTPTFIYGRAPTWKTCRTTMALRMSGN